MKNEPECGARIKGYLCAAGAFFSWGFYPLYWKRLTDIPSLELLAHRILWSFFFVGGFILLSQPKKFPAALAEVKTWFFLLGTSILIALNWFLYIWAVEADRIVEASLGYYINPLMNVFLGMLFLKERLKGLQKIALGVSAIGVLYLAVDYGKFPWLAVILAAAFGLYGLLKKLTPVDSLWSLFAETTVLLPIAAAFIVGKELNGTGAFLSKGVGTDLLLVLAGVITSFPLFLFGTAAQLIPLSSVGFFQYLSPSLMLIFGVFLYGEPFTLPHAVCFGCIWIALTLYTLSMLGYPGKKSSSRSS